MIARWRNLFCRACFAADRTTLFFLHPSTAACGGGFQALTPGLERDWCLVRDCWSTSKRTKRSRVAEGGHWTKDLSVGQRLPAKRLRYGATGLVFGVGFSADVSVRGDDSFSIMGTRSHAWKSLESWGRRHTFGDELLRVLGRGRARIQPLPWKIRMVSLKYGSEAP